MFLHLRLSDGLFFLCPRLGSWQIIIKPSLKTDFTCFQIILRDSLVSALQFSQTRDAEIAWVDGQLVKEHLKSLTQGEERMDVDTFDSVPVLEQLPLTEVGWQLGIVWLVLVIGWDVGCVSLLGKRGGGGDECNNWGRAECRDNYLLDSCVLVSSYCVKIIQYMLWGVRCMPLLWLWDGGLLLLWRGRG